jgi:hypothetical protein
MLSERRNRDALGIDERLRRDCVRGRQQGREGIHVSIKPSFKKFRPSEFGYAKRSSSSENQSSVTKFRAGEADRSLTILPLQNSQNVRYMTSDRVEVGFKNNRPHFIVCAVCSANFLNGEGGNADQYDSTTC